MDLSQSFWKKPEKCGKKIFPHILLFESKLDHNSALHAKIREKSLLIESRIEFPYSILMTLDRGKISFSPLLIQKLDHNSALHVKNQREISSNKVRRLLWLLGRGKCGKGGGNGNVEMWTFPFKVTFHAWLTTVPLKPLSDLSDQWSRRYCRFSMFKTVW